MTHPLRFIAITAMLALIGGCTSTPQQQNTADRLTPLPPKAIDPPDEAVKAAVDNFLKRESAPVASQYSFSRVDLNGDKRRDALVLFKNPHGYWCDVYGCAMLVLKASDKTFTTVNKVSPVREPIYVSDTRTKGWREIVVRISGRWSKSKNVALQFDGRRYPGDPSELPENFYRALNKQERFFVE